MSSPCEPSRVRVPGRLLVALLLVLTPVSLALPVHSAGATTEPSQKGLDLDAEAADDEAGSAVALSDDGLTVAVGAPKNDGTAADAGHVRVHRWNGSAWVQRGEDIDGEAGGDQAGFAVALSADGLTVAVGAPENDGTGSRAGHVRIHRWNGSAWVQRGEDIDGEAAGDRSGFAVALSDDGLTVAIGAPFNEPVDTGIGHVRLYRWNGSAWVQRGGDIDGEAAGDEFGRSVALSSDGLTVAIGAHLNDPVTANEGHVRVHRWDGSAWVQRGVDIDGASEGDQVGHAVALSSDGLTLAIGANMNDTAGMNAGRVRVHRWDGSAWVQRGVDITGESASDQSGYSVALSSDGLTVAIGAILNAPRGGHVRVHRWDGSAWSQDGVDIDGESAGNWSGFAVALSSDGRTVAVGAPRNGGLDGHVRVWAFTPLAQPETAAAPPAVSCAPLPVTVGATVTCTVTGGDAGIDILWRAAYNPVFAEAGVTLDASGSGEFAFVVPAAALGEEVTVELVEWLAPVSLGVAAGPVPSSVPSGEGPVPVWSLVLLVVAGGLALRRMGAVSVRG